MIKNVVVMGSCLSGLLVVGAGCGSKTVVTETDIDAGPSPDEGSGSGADAGAGGSKGGQTFADAGTQANDSGTGASTADASSASTCAPADVSTFTAAWKGPTALAQHKCTQAQIDAYYTDCLASTATNATCAPHGTGPDLPCSQCILTPDTAATLGPIIEKEGLVNANIAGCIAAVQSDTAGTGCGGKVQATSQCDDKACGANCPVTDDTSFKAYQQCVSDAEMGGCASYVTAAACTMSLTGAAATCVSGMTFQDTYNAIVPKFCL